MASSLTCPQPVDGHQSLHPGRQSQKSHYIIINFCFENMPHVITNASSAMFGSTSALVANSTNTSANIQVCQVVNLISALPRKPQNTKEELPII